MEGVKKLWMGKVDRNFLPKGYERKSFLLNEKKDYEELKEFITSLVGADCWAVTLNNEIIYDFYDENVSFREKILQNVIRREIYENPHTSLLVHLNRNRTEDSRIIIYMFGSDPWGAEIDYKAEYRCYYLSFLKFENIN